MKSGKCGKGWRQGAGGKCIRAIPSDRFQDEDEQKVFYEEQDKLDKLDRTRARLGLGYGLAAGSVGLLGLATLSRKKMETNSKNRVEQGGRKDSLRRSDRKSPGKCGKGWESGPSGKCVRKPRGKRQWITAGLNRAEVGELDTFLSRHEKRRGGRSKIPSSAKIVAGLAGANLALGAGAVYGLKKLRGVDRDLDAKNVALEKGQKDHDDQMEQLKRSLGKRGDSSRRKPPGSCGRGWKPRPGGGCDRRSGAKVFGRALLSGAGTVAGITAGRLAIGAGTSLAIKGISKMKELRQRSHGTDKTTSSRKDAAPKAKCDEKHGWTRGGQGKCIRSQRRKQFAKGYQSGAVTAAAILGLSAAGYSAARAKYRANIPKAANMAVKRSKEIDPATLPDFKDKEGILLAQPGFTGFAGKTQAAGIEKIMGDGLTAAAGDTYGTFMLSNQKFNIFMPDKVPEGWNPNDMSTYRPSGRIEQFIAPTVQRFLKTTVKDGYNEQSIEATAYLLAMEDKFRRQNPGKEPVIKAAGYSAGGMILADSNMQLKHLGKDVEMLFLGSPYFGLADDSKTMTRIVSSNDPVMKLGSSGFKNVHRFNQVKNHIKYQEDPGVQKVVNNWLQKGVSRPIPGLRADSLAHKKRIRRRASCL